MTRPRKTLRQLAKELAEEHWNWLDSVLSIQREMEKKLFIDAFMHGVKHGKEDK